MTSLNFPASPTNGQVYENFTYDSALGVWKKTGGAGAASITVSDTVPANPIPGGLWLDSTTGNTYIYYEDANTSQWIQTAGPELIANRNSEFFIQTTPPASPVDGDIWYDSSEGFTYIYYVDVDSSQWVQFGLNRNGANGINGASGQGVPVGGTTGQVLTKSSSTDYATEWSNQIDTSSFATTGKAIAMSIVFG